MFVLQQENMSMQLDLDFKLICHGLCFIQIWFKGACTPVTLMASKWSSYMNVFHEINGDSSAGLGPGFETLGVSQKKQNHFWRPLTTSDHKRLRRRTRVTFTSLFSLLDDVRIKEYRGELFIMHELFQLR